MNDQSASQGTNGYVEAPLMSGGASRISRVSQPRTVFLPDVPVQSIYSTIYASRRFLLGAAPAGRYFTLSLLMLAAIWATGLLPGRWIGVAILLLLFAAYLVAVRVLSKRDYVTFRAGSLPAVVPSATDPGESLPVYATGRLSVEGKEQRFTCLPGFYKTFATREHAVLCLVRDRRAYGLLRWPQDETGMWYGFFEPDAVQRIEWGSLSFAAQPMPALAVEYELCEKKPNRFRRGENEICRNETLYISARDEGILRRIVADLAADVPVEELIADVRS